MYTYDESVYAHIYHVYTMYVYAYILKYQLINIHIPIVVVYVYICRLLVYSYIISVLIHASYVSYTHVIYTRSHLYN